jgi:hypothetical protein
MLQNAYLCSITSLPPRARSYKQVRQRPEFAGRSIITMVTQDATDADAAAAGSNGNSRQLASAAELDPFMLAEVVAAAQQGYTK